EVADAHIHGDAQVEPLRLPLRELRDRVVEHTGREQPHHCGPLRHADQVLRAYHSAPRVTPAQQRLDTHHRTRGDVDLRLVVQLDLIGPTVVERPAQLRHELQTLRVVLVGL